MVCVCKIFGQIENNIFFLFFPCVESSFLDAFFHIRFFFLTLPQVSGFFWLLHIRKIRVRFGCRVLSLFIEMWKFLHLIKENTICSQFRDASPGCHMVS